MLKLAWFHLEEKNGHVIGDSILLFFSPDIQGEHPKTKQNPARARFPFMTTARKEMNQKPSGTFEFDLQNQRVLSPNHEMKCNS